MTSSIKGSFPYHFIFKNVLFCTSVYQLWHIVRRQTVCIEYSFEYLSLNGEFSFLFGKSIDDINGNI